jgi:UDP-N-acetylmuramoyl-L-alanyl-D-glutamate--2,6-diaminopimelate ligase
VVCDDTRQAAGALGQAILGWPCRALRTVGVTGTNGKTTVAWLTRHALSSLGNPTAMLGTVQYDTGLRVVDASRTTPDAVALAALSDEARRAGCTHLVMEVSSHALDQDRCAGIAFDVGVFTNLTGDHLDYHGTMEGYLAAKRRLFDRLDATATAVVNVDDPHAEAMIERTAARVLRFGLGQGADVRGELLEAGADGTRWRLSHGGASAVVATGLIGRHNVYNALAASAACIALGAPVAELGEALGAAPSAPGRLQRVGEPGQAVSVFVDYAHTDDALANVLGALRPITSGALWVVVGCGGERDRTKRPRMAATADRLADRVVLTSDNPRRESPEAILEEMLSGLGSGSRARVRVEPDRRRAIVESVAGAEAGDVVLIAGKGHETVQVVGSRRLPFDDRQVAAEALRARKAGA